MCWGRGAICDVVVQIFKYFNFTRQMETELVEGDGVEASGGRQAGRQGFSVFKNYFLCFFESIV